MISRMARKTPRSYGSGGLQERNGKWIGHAVVRGKRVSRTLGPARAPSSSDGLTRRMAEDRLRAWITTVQNAPVPVMERMTVKDAGEALIASLTAEGRKTSTLQDYESALRVHLAPHFASTPIANIDRRDVEAFVTAQRDRGAAPKSIRNRLGLLHSIFTYAEREGWVTSNPVRLARKPRITTTDPDLRFLDAEELEALLHAVRDDVRGPTEKVMYMTAAMTGMRQGELLALRWMDVDWPAGRVRVRRSYVRGEYGTPKSKRSSRAIPLAPVLAGELDLHFQRSAYQADDDLVFPHPQTGAPLDRSRLLKRFKAALRRAGVRDARMHDLRHTFGTRMAAQGVPLRTLQEWMGHRDLQTTQIYADYQPNANREADLVGRAFARQPDVRDDAVDGGSTDSSTDPRETKRNH
jgi:integrase